MMLDTKEKIHDWLDGIGIKKYVINDNLTVDVNGGVNLTKYQMTEIPIQFGIVTGDFFCNDNQLTSLKGCPHEVQGWFHCGNNNLTNLDYCPKIIGENLIIDFNPITNLKGFNSDIGKNIIHCYSPRNPVKIQELEAYYEEEKILNGNIVMKFCVSAKEVKSILSYYELNENLQSDNKVTIKGKKI